MEKKRPEGSTEETLSYPVRIFFDKYTPVEEGKEESANVVAVSPSGVRIRDNPSIWNLDTGESFPLFDTWQSLGKDTRVFYSYDHKHLFIFSGLPGIVRKFDSKIFELVDIFSFHAPARTAEEKAEEKKRVEREGRRSLYGTNLKPVGERIVGMHDGRFLVYDQREHNIQKIDIYVQAFCRLNDNEILFVTMTFTREPNPLGGITLKGERVLNSLNLVTYKETRIASLNTIFPLNVEISDMDLVGDTVFFRSHTMRGARETDHTTTLWSLKKKKKVRSLKFETLYVSEVSKGKAFIHIFSSEKGFSLAIISLSGNILRSKKVYEGSISRCRNGNFAFASKDPNKNEFRVYNEKLNVIFKTELGWSRQPILCLDPTIEDRKNLVGKLNGLMENKIPRDLVGVIQGFF